MKIAIASDHGGYELKEIIKDKFVDKYDWLDLGTDSAESTDYPEFGHAMAKAITSGEVVMGVLVCGTGVGISIAANRHQGVRAAVCTNTTMARLAREHNDANVLALGSRITGVEVALECVDTFLTGSFEQGGRHSRRVEKIDNIA